MNIFCYTDLAIPYEQNVEQVFHLNALWRGGNKIPESKFTNIDRRDFFAEKRKNNTEVIEIFTKSIDIYKSFFNELFQKNYSSRFYEILISKPLIEIVTSFYYVKRDIEYLLDIHQSLGHFKISYLNIEPQHISTSEDLHDFVSSRSGAQFIFQFIISRDPAFFLLKNNFIEVVNKNLPGREKKAKKYKRQLKYLLFSFLNIGGNSKDSIFIDSNVGISKTIISNYFKNILFFKDVSIDDKFQNIKRFYERLGENDNHLLDPVLIDALNFLFPKVYFILPSEYTRLFNSYSLPSRIKKIYSFNVFSSYLVSLYKAVNVEKGAKLYYIQHGGGYNIHEFLIHEYLERKTSNYFISAGNAHSNDFKYSSKVLNFNFHKKKPKHLYWKSKNIVSVQLLDNYYNEYIPLSDVSSKVMTSYIERIEGLIKLSGMRDLKFVLKFQMYPHILSYDFCLYFNDNYENFIFWKKGTKSSKVYCNSDLVILTYLSTGILELVDLNRPFILFLDSNLCYNYDFNKFISRFRELNILFYDVTNLIDFLESTDISKWFYSKNVQDIIKEFSKLYVRSNDLKDIESLYE
jgi:putative transferase (TIGR04331 family)